MSDELPPVVLSTKEASLILSALEDARDIESHRIAQQAIYDSYQLPTLSLYLKKLHLALDTLVPKIERYEEMGG